MLGSVEDTQVAAAVIAMITKDTHHLANGTCHLGIPSDVQCDGNEYVKPSTIMNYLILLLLIWEIKFFKNFTHAYH